MQLTVQQIIDMIDNNELHYNQSTQRNFIYTDPRFDAQLACGTTSKAGSLINAILEEHIQLPAVYFWHNVDTGDTNIHDGKQRILSLYYFIKSTSNTKISTIKNGVATYWTGLSPEDQEYLLNYKLDVVERTGTSEEEERSFYLLNTNSINLTTYECLSGMYHGAWLDEFEMYINTLAQTLTNVKPIGRGEQAYKFLFSIFNLAYTKTKAEAANIDSNLNTAIKAVRQQSFDPTVYAFDQIIMCFDELMTAIKGLKDERAIAVANYIVRKGYDATAIVNAYRLATRQVNDINIWDIATHKTYIDAFINGKTLCAKRFFDKTTKDKLYAKSPRCAYIDPVTGQRCTETNYSKLEVDHIKPWSQGGQTTDDNAQLLCKHHNTSKGNNITVIY